MTFQNATLGLMVKHWLRQEKKKINHWLLHKMLPQAYRHFIPKLQALLGHTLAAVIIFGFLALLLVFVFFQVILNSSDPDLKYFARRTLSSAMTLYVALLVLSIFDLAVRRECTEKELYLGGVARECHEKKLSLDTELAMSMIQFMFWYVVLQIPTYRTGASNCACFVWLVTDLMIAAAIKMWSLVQLLLHESSDSKAVLVVPLAVVIHTLLAFTGWLVRAKACGRSTDSRMTKWKEFVLEGDYTAFSFVISYLMVRMLRFKACGLWPNELDIIGHLHVYHGKASNEAFLRQAFIQQIVYMAIGVTIGLVVASLAGLIRERHCMNRRLIVLIKEFSFWFSAWCVTFGSVTIVALVLLEWDLRGSEVIAVATATVLSIASVIVTLIADKLADLECTGPMFDKTARGFMRMTSLCIVSSWFYCFRLSIRWLPGDPLVMQIVLVSVFLPAWYFYIFPDSLHDSESWKGASEGGELEENLMTSSDSE
eukprot:gnl/TRDRNA2_/TRDRNA2_161788_c0_seq1.p1 gnl/TRDRNA2_/TRDRNA2_161788_c0~~gnl/TRDRNA2_/TRDRNA2_161788_c0_seq1.p1  ORF type:complete len:483 (-),score=28.46 gnl/TRDRNA2_/TRDRNA2_161788_c0_seq1:247-1695(-)